eukprot:CAMPEP_0196592390 /NCGR_PEP_ID=MMETSP1081-20130531/72622_1 /TAXON_ID=36882 /ORGANISM="Pyramimonas amylifera, Strain CCMP720" /LENGTH=569 /DNA_ID=CAMNT_0041916077 /DNA_START=290 /DNA_END=2000 /DNA_ORIENTATION=-
MVPSEDIFHFTRSAVDENSRISDSDTYWPPFPTVLSQTDRLFNSTSNLISFLQTHKRFLLKHSPELAFLPVDTTGILNSDTCNGPFSPILRREDRVSGSHSKLTYAISVGSTTTVLCALFFGSYQVGFARAEVPPSLTNNGPDSFYSAPETRPFSARRHFFPQFEFSDASEAMAVSPIDLKTSEELNNVEIPISDLEVVEEAWRVVDENYLPSRGRTFDRSEWRTQLDKALQRPPSDRNSAYQVVRGMLGALKDPYTRFVSPGEFQSMGKYDITGVGLNLGDYEGEDGAEVRVLGLVTESTASQAGARQGDTVLAVDGESTKGLSAFQIATRIQGPTNTEVTVRVRHSEAEGGKEQDVVCMRMQGVNSPVSFRFQAPSTGVITLREFNGLAGRDVAAALAALEAKGVDRFVLDLRDNGGGLVQAAQEIVRLFTGGDTTVVYTENRPDRQGLVGPPVKAVRTRGEGAASTAPLIVLVNSRTASASEIVSGALKDNCRAALVGTRTYGKGLIQAVYELSDGSGLVITVGKYLTPSHVDIDQHGITPDFDQFPGFDKAQDVVNKCIRPDKSG